MSDSTPRDRGSEASRRASGAPLERALEAPLEPGIEAPLEPADAAPRRRRVARGMVVNSGFFVALGTLALLKTVIVAGLLDESEFGVWSIVFLAYGFVWTLKTAAVVNKYVQQDDPDEEGAFQKAFTLELASALATMALMAVLAPLLALVYGESALLAPALVIGLTLPGLAMQAPAWIFYRRLEFLQQRLLASVDPIASFAVTIALAEAGLGYWSLVLGLVAGAYVGGVVALIASPHRIALRWDRRTLREYVAFSWPLLGGIAAAMAIAELSVLFGDAALGLAGAGAIGLAATFAAYAQRIDAVVTQTIYPAICRVRDRDEVMFEVFLKSNRLALMWAVPFGVGLSLFAGDLVEFGIGERWSDALVLLQVFGLTQVVGHVGFNWVAFYRALGRTRPELTVNLISLASFLVVIVPLLFAFGLDGFAAGTAVLAVVAFAARRHYLAKLFPRLRLLAYTARALAPALPAVAIVLAARTAVGGERTLGLALAELSAFVLVTAIATALAERRLIAEALSYLRTGPQAEPRPA